MSNLAKPDSSLNALAESLPVRVYSPERAIQHPAILLMALWKDILAGRELAWRLFVRDLSAQYRQTYLGYVWAVLPPLVTSMTFIFLQSQGITKIEGMGIPFAPFAMMGTLIWQTFVDALGSPLASVNSAKPMLAKINFPREAILMAGMYMVVFKPVHSPCAHGWSDVCVGNHTICIACAVSLCDAWTLAVWFCDWHVARSHRDSLW